MSSVKLPEKRAASYHSRRTIRDSEDEASSEEGELKSKYGNNKPNGRAGTYFSKVSMQMGPALVLPSPPQAFVGLRHLLTFYPATYRKAVSCTARKAV